METVKVFQWAVSIGLICAPVGCYFAYIMYQEYKKVKHINRIQEKIIEEYEKKEKKKEVMQLSFVNDTPKEVSNKLSSVPNSLITELCKKHNASTFLVQDAIIFAGYPLYVNEKFRDTFYERVERYVRYLHKLPKFSGEPVLDKSKEKLNLVFDDYDVFYI